jgi:phage-related protein
MAQAEFTWFPDSGSKKDTEFSMLEAKFGDGYGQRAKNGINAIQAKWDLTFTRGNTEANAIVDFLDARNGAVSFKWINPRNQVGSYICKKYSITRFEDAPLISQVNAVFELVYDIL